MVSPELVAKFAALGVDLERVRLFSIALMCVFDGANLSPIERVAILRTGERAVLFDREDEDPAFPALVEQLGALVLEGDREVREHLQREDAEAS